jgi:hypothetical protein
VKALVGVGAFALFLSVAPRGPLGSATQLGRLATARALLGGSLDIAVAAAELPVLADGAATTVRHGRRFAVEPPGAALALVPAAAIAALAHASLAPAAGPTGVAAVGRPATTAAGPANATKVAPATSVGARVAHFAATATAALAAALVCVLFFAGARRLGASTRAALVVTAALAFATQLFAAARVPDGSALGALLLFAAVQAARATSASRAGDATSASRAGDATSGTRSLGATLVLGAAGGAAALVDGAYALPALVAVLASAVRQLPDRARAARVALPAAVLVAAGAAATFAHARTIGFEPPPGDLAEGLVGLLLSTGKNVFLYSPPLALAPLALAALWRTRRADAALTLAVAAALVLALARTHDWHGDPAWGPRRALPLVPLALEPLALWLDAAARAARRALVPAVIALGVLVQLEGAALAPTDYLRVLATVRNSTGATLWFTPTPSQAHFVPPFSPIIGQAWLLWHLLRHDRDGSHDAPWRQLVPGTPRLEAEWPKLRIDWWALDASPRGR